MSKEWKEWKETKRVSELGGDRGTWIYDVCGESETAFIGSDITASVIKNTE